MRLLYVALTRAKHHCHLVGGNIKGGENSPIHGLFPQGASSTQISEGDPAADFRDLAEKNGRLFSFRYIGEPLFPPAAATDNAPANPSPLARRELPRKSDTSWRISSFSSLSGSLRGEAHEDGDEYLHSAGLAAAKGYRDVGQRDIFSFPRGAEAGNFFHSLLATVDFTNTEDKSLTAAIATKLRTFGFAAHWCEAIRENLATLVSSPLPATAGSFCLNEIAPNRRVAEMEFYFHLKRITPSSLGSLLSAHWRGASTLWKEGMGKFLPTQGFLKGFIDLVFEHRGRYYIVDWKSHHLGDAAACYDGPALTREMEASLYPLQYLSYTVALHLFLKSKIAGYSYERHFGDVFYIFLRGVDAKQKTGIYRARPSLAEIELLTSVLTPQPAP